MSKGLVGIICNDSARYSLFSSCVDRLDLPEGWKKEWVIGGDWCGARNGLCQMVLDEGYSHLWFMDDDHAFAPSLLTRLLEHDEPLVTPICLTRRAPFPPVQFTEKVGENLYLPIPLSAAETNGLVEIEAGGCAGMLIRREVIEAIEPPWFEYADRSEDIIFCEHAKEAGFKLHADLSARLGHITTAVVEPAVREGDWCVGLTIGSDFRVMVDGDENVVVERPGQPATVQSWIWELRSVLTDAKILSLLLPAGTPFNYLPDAQRGGEFVRGLLQWYCDSGEGFQPVGDPFTYYPEEG